jgi:hypothetical protein
VAAPERYQRHGPSRPALGDPGLVVIDVVPSFLRLAGCTTSGCVLASASDRSSNTIDAVIARDPCFVRVSMLHSDALIIIDAEWGWDRDVSDAITHLSATRSLQ